MRLPGLLGLVVGLSGCLLFFDDGGKGGDCVISDLPTEAPEPPPLRNPDTLTCESFGGFPCDPACGPCPAREADIAQPSWGVCGSECEALDESTCGSRADCRIIKDAACAVGSAVCLTDFLGCFPTDMLAGDDLDCLSARDGQTCSTSSACTAFHRNNSCTTPECTRDFAFCMPEGASPGRCEPASCRAAPPPCPSGTTPGVENGCFTGACIPDDLCQPA